MNSRPNLRQNVEEVGGSVLLVVWDYFVQDMTKVAVSFSWSVIVWWDLLLDFNFLYHIVYYDFIGCCILGEWGAVSDGPLIVLLDPFFGTLLKQFYGSWLWRPQTRNELTYLIPSNRWGLISPHPDLRTARNIAKCQFSSISSLSSDQWLRTWLRPS